LHHPTCQAPIWYEGEENGLIIRSKPSGNHTTYLTAGIVFNYEIPVILINPSLELAHLQSDGKGIWKNTTISTYRKAHHMAPGGPEPAPRDQPAIGAAIEILQDRIKIDLGIEGWIVEPGKAIIAAAERAQGILLGLSTLYSGEDLTFDDAMKILSNPQFTAQAWVPTRPLSPPGLPAAEYLIYKNNHYATVGQVIYRSADPPLPTDETRSWLKLKLESDQIVPRDRLIDGPGSYADDDAAWLIDAISMNMYAAIRISGGWRVIRSLSRYGGQIDAQSLLRWANSAMTTKSLHRIAAEWHPEPDIKFGRIWTAHMLPTEQ
jgi:hypothetical protein